MIRVNPPDSLPVIRAAAHVAGLACCDDDLIGTWVRLLAASKPGGTLLHLATGTGELAAWLAAGMDLSSRLVTLIEAEAVATAVTETIAQDLRVTVHRQDVDEFLDDVQAHRFDLIVHDQVPPRARIEAAWRLLSAGGLLVVPGLPPASSDETSNFAAIRGTLESLADACVSLGPNAAPALIAAKRTPRPEAVRRGGRRARRGDGTVTGLRARQQR